MKMSSSVPSNICFNPLHDTLSVTSLETLSSIISTCLGPRGKLKLLRNASGGSSTVTSSSQRLFRQLSAKNIFSKIISSAALLQLRTYNDNGLLCSLLALNLVHTALPLPSHGALCGHLGGMFIECLKSKSNPCTFSVDFSNLTHLKCLVNAVLSSKPGCLLTTTDRNHLCNLLLEAFLNVVPSKLMDNHNIRILFCGGREVKCSRSYNGLLVRVPLPVNVSISGPFKTVLFAMSLVGDVPFKTLEGGVSSGAVLEAILENAESVVRKVIEEGVQIVFCQKVVHPRLKKQLQKANILVLDRLGSETTKYVQYLSGGNSNASLFSEITFGTISRIEEQKVGEDCFLLLSNDFVPLYSIVLCSSLSEETGQELMVVCRQAIDALFRVLKSSQVCFGGGCTEIYTANMLIKTVQDNLSTIQDETGCSSVQVHSALQAFVHSVANVCTATHQGSRINFVTDTMFGHLWKLRPSDTPSGDYRCACGHVSSASLPNCSWRSLSDMDGSSMATPLTNDCSAMVVLDELSCKIGSCSLAVETAALLLRTTLFLNASSEMMHSIGSDQL